MFDKQVLQALLRAFPLRAAVRLIDQLAVSAGSFWRQLPHWISQDTKEVAVAFAWVLQQGEVWSKCWSVVHVGGTWGCRFLRDPMFGWF